MTREEAIAYYKKLAIRIKGIIADEDETHKDRFSQTLEATNMAIQALQTENTISLGVYKQVRWERDIAIEQLEELGYSLGEKIEHCEDAVSRQAVFDILNRSEWKTPEELEVFELVKKLPSVNSMQSSDVISRQMALDTVDNLRTIITNNMPALIYKGSVLKWLHELPSAQTEHNVSLMKVDLISRQAAIDEFVAEKDAWEYYGIEHDEKKYVEFDWVIDRLKELPSVTPQKVGRWTHDGSTWENRWLCECGYKLFGEKTKYCPNCGAKMEGGESNEQSE